MITTENYYSQEIDNQFLSVSQYNHFWGTSFRKGCEACTVASLKGEWKTEPSTAMLIGSYVDAYFSGELEKFKKETPQLFTLKGDLRADFKNADEIIACAESDKMFMDYVKGDGEAQVIVTGNIGGSQWKGRIDRIHRQLAIVDLKVVASIHDKIWDNFEGIKKNFVEAYGYIRQGAVYQELWYQMSGEKLPFFIAAISKEKYPDKEIIQIHDLAMEYALKEIIENVPHMMRIKQGQFPPLRCEECDYCRATKKLTNTITIYDL